MVDKVNNASQIVRDAQDKALKMVIKYSQPKKIISMFQLMLSAFALVGIQIVSYNFDFSKLMEVNFWLKLVSSLAGITLLFRAVVSLRQSSTESRPNVVQARNKYVELNQKKQLDLKKYLEELNLEKKTEVYVGLVNAKIYKLERKISKSKKEKKITKLTKKLDELKLTITQAYILEHIDRLNVKYNKIYYTDFNDIDVQGSSDGNYLTRGVASYARDFSKTTFKNMWMYVLCTVLIGIGLPTATETTAISYVSTISLTLLVIVIRVGQAILSADRLYDANITRSYIDRATILEQYLEWQKNNPTSSAFLQQLEEEKKKLEEQAQAKWKEHYREQAETLIQEGLEQIMNNK